MDPLEPRMLLSRVLFDAASTYGAGWNVSSVIAADFNGDGKADLAVANADGLSVMLNDGLGSLDPKVDYATGDWPVSVIAADFNGDGHLDLAVANSNSDTVSILLNNSNGTFAAKVDYATGASPWSLIAADFNGDGKADLAVANTNDNTVSVLLNNGHGTFAAKVDYATGANPVSVTAADFNGDGKADLAVACGGGVGVLLNNGNGTFAAEVDSAAGTNPQSVAAADFNGDGKADLAVANYGSNTVSVLLNNGDGTFATRVNYTTGLWPTSITAADFNGDGKADLAVANYDAATVSVLLNKGSGTFAAKVDYTTGAHPSSVTSADFNEDGKLDLVVANMADGTVNVLLNHGNGTFDTKVNFATGSDPVSVTSADLNGDGKTDLVVVNRLDNTVSVLMNNGSGSFFTRVNYATGRWPVSVTAADFNGDGYVDLAVVNSHDNTVSVLLNNSNGTFAAKVDYATGLWPVSVIAADFNGDGKADLAVANTGDDANPGSTVSVLLNNGDGTFASKVDYTTGSRPSSLTAADFNGDGMPDLAVASGSGVSVLLNNSDGTFAASADYAMGTSSDSIPISVVSADLNGDGAPDLAVLTWDPVLFTASVSVRMNNGDGSLAGDSDYTVADQEAYSLTAADFNADGYGDLAVAVQYSDTVSVLLNNRNDGTFAPKQDFSAGYAPVSLAVADFNGDGYVDLALANERNNTVSVLHTRNPAAVNMIWSHQPSNSIAGHTLAPLVVYIEDAAGHIVADDNSFVTVSVATGPGGSVNGTTTVSAIHGVATFSDLSLTMAGAYTLAASAGFLSTSASNNFTISPDAASQVAFTEDPVDGQVGPLSEVTVAVEDEFGNIVTTDDSTVSVALASGDGSFLQGTLAVDAVDGVATFSDLALHKSGTYALVASDGALTADTSGDFTLSPGTATHLAFYQQPVSGATVVPITFSVAVEDQDNNVVGTDSSTVVIGVSNGPATPSWVMVGAADHGVVTFRNLSIPQAGIYRLIASDGGLLGVTSNDFTVGAKLVFQQQPTSANAGAALSPALKVLIEDAGGRLLTTENSAVTLSIASGPVGAAVGGTATVHAVNGVATFSNVWLEKAGAYKLRATDGTIAPATSQNFTIAPTAAVHMAYGQNSWTCTAGVKMAPGLSLGFTDQYGNVAVNYKGTVTLSVATGPGTLSGTPSTTVKNGVATFSNLILQRAGAYTLHATCGAFGLDSGSLTVSPGAAKKLVFGQPPTAALVGADIAPAITVNVVDAYGNLVVTSAANLTLAIASGPKGGKFTGGSSGGTFTSIAAAAVHGVATFSDVALSTAGVYKLKATAAGLTLVTSGSITIG